MMFSLIEYLMFISIIQVVDIVYIITIMVLIQGVAKFIKLVLLQEFRVFIT